MKLAEGEPPPLHPHPHSSITLAYAIAIIPQNLSCVSTLYEDFFIIYFSKENLDADQVYRNVCLLLCLSITGGIIYVNFRTGVTHLLHSSEGMR